MGKERRELGTKHLEGDAKELKLELMRHRYRYLQKQYEDARVRSADKSMESTCEGMVREKAAIDVLTKYGVLEMAGRCSM